MVQVKLTRERTVIPFIDHWRATEFFYKKATEEPQNSNVFYMAALTFLSFTLEAYLNHIGHSRIKSWNKKQFGSWKDKIKIITKHFDINADFQYEPWKTTTVLANFRHPVAHGKDEFLSASGIYSIPQAESVSKEWLQSEYENTIISQKPHEIRENIYELFNIINQPCYGCPFPGGVVKMQSRSQRVL
ncbi:MAG: hypothetical protein ACFCUR_11795 [Rhodomicrobiaceae bacterium]